VAYAPGNGKRASDDGASKEDDEFERVEQANTKMVSYSQKISPTHSVHY